MRLRLTVKRHGLPDAPIVWTVESETITISKLLEEVHEAIPIESGDWGFEDYAVELKGANGVNFECLHYQNVGKVFKEDDEIIIRPLLTQDLKVRKISGRHQISADGKHLVDGLAFGRPLLRRPADRPSVNIPPRKKRRVTYNEIEDDLLEDEDEFLALEEREAMDDSELESNDNQQLILHADFDDDDSEEDDDFAPEGDEEPDDDSVESDDSEESNNNQQLVLHADFDNDDSEEDNDFSPEGDEEAHDSDESEDLEELEGSQELDASDEPEILETQALDAMEHIQGIPSIDTDKHPSGVAEDNEEALRSVKSASLRGKIRKLHSTFPKSSLAVCKHVLSGSNGDLGQAYDALVYGFRPIEPKSALVESLQDDLSTSKKNKKPLESVAEVSGLPGSMDLDPNDESDGSEESENSVVGFFDQNGLPPGSIASGKALSFMAEAISTSPNHPTSLGPVKTNKKIFFQDDENLANGLTSTPFIDQDSQTHDNKVDADDDSSDDDSSDTTSSSGSSSEEESEDKDNSTSNSDSSSDSSSGSSSDSEDDGPEEISNRSTSATSATSKKSESTSAQNVDAKLGLRKVTAPGSGKNSTKSRNQRRRKADIINRFVNKGILPAGFTSAEFDGLEIKGAATDATVSAALETLKSKDADERNTSITDAPFPELSNTLSQSDEFEARKQRLLDDLAASGVAVGPNSKKESQVPLQPNARLPTPTTSTGSHTAMDIEAKKAIIPPFIASDEVHSQSPSHINDPLINVESISASATKGERTPIDDVTPVQHLLASQASPTSMTATITSSVPTGPIPPTSSAKSTEGSERRSRLNVGAVQRMLFGSLGKRAPKSKLDQDKLRNDFMKDVRPIVTQSQPHEGLVQEATGQEEDEDLDSWKEKINYRAVECCYDGIELSVPPFPFVQRWDPQQQGGWSQNGNRGGKRKQEQRDQPQFYEENRASKKQKPRKGKHNYAQEQEYLDDNYEPIYQEDSLMYDEEQSQESKISTNGMEADITLQLLDDLNVDPGTGISQEPDDLASLPDDPSTLPDLLPGQAKQGTTIAFKQLVMTADTNWQPLVSAYRTAIVIDTPAGGEIEVILAKRDQQQPTTKNFDEDTGQRIYGKFEMPIDENDEDDLDPEHGGKLYLKFEEMMEPKIVQEPPADTVALNELYEQKQNHTTDGPVTLSHEGERVNPEAQFSSVTETLLSSNATGVSRAEEDYRKENDGTTALDNEVHHMLLPIPESLNLPVPNLLEARNNLDLSVAAIEEKDIKLVGQDSTKVIASKSHTTQNEAVTLLESTSDASKERISLIMKEAGFGSSVSSSINRIIRPDGMESPGDTALFDKLRTEMSETPLNPPYSPKFNGIGSSSPIRKLQDSPQSPRKGSLQHWSSLPTPQLSWQTINSIEQSSPILRSGPQDSVELVEGEHGNEEDWEDVQEEKQSPQSSPPVPRQRSIKKAISNLLATSVLPEIKGIWEQSMEPNIPEFGVRSSIKAAEGKAGQILVSRSPSAAAQEPNCSLLDKSVPLSFTSSGGLNQIEYPKLFTGSSFTSHVSDYGRQSDVDFHDSAALNADISSSFPGAQNFLGPIGGSVHSDEAFLERVDDEVTDVVSEPELHPSRQPVSEETINQQQEPKPDSVLEQSSQESFAGGDLVNGLEQEFKIKVHCPICQCTFVNREDVEAHASSACHIKPLFDGPLCIINSSSDGLRTVPSRLLEDTASPGVEGPDSEARVSSKAFSRTTTFLEDLSSDDFPNINELLVSNTKESRKAALSRNTEESSAQYQNAPRPSQLARKPQTRSSAHKPFRASRVLKSLSQAPPPRSPRRILPKISSSQPPSPGVISGQPLKRTIPQNAVVWDLTMSSDAEPESDKR